MRTSLAIAAVLTGLVFWTEHATAADQRRAIVTAEKDVPKGPRICLFSQNSRRAEPSPVNEAETIEAPQTIVSNASDDPTPQQPAAPPEVEVAQSERVPTEKAAVKPLGAPQAPNRICDTDVTTAAPHG